jgi:hypothetical protein
MAVGALIGAYQEDDGGALRALLPLSGRTLLEYQVRCAAATGAQPIVVVVERVPQGLQDALERLRLDSISAVAVSDVHDAVSRFDAGSRILMIGDGIAAAADLMVEIAEEPEPAVATLPDTEEYDRFERIDAQARWAGVALVDASALGSTAAMLGDWDLLSTLLRRTLQDGARRIAIDEARTPLLANAPEDLSDFQSRLLVASRGGRTDWASRYLLAPLEEFATLRLMETDVRPPWLVWAALLLTLVAAICFTRGWLGAGLVALLLATPLDLIAARLGVLRLRPLPARMPTLLALWPASGLALLAIGWWQMRHGTGWGAAVTALSAIAFAEAARIERSGIPEEAGLWLFSRRNAVLAAIPFALAGAWTAYLVAMLIYAAGSFFLVQHVRHRPTELTRS